MWDGRGIARMDAERRVAILQPVHQIEGDLTGFGVFAEQARGDEEKIAHGLFSNVALAIWLLGGTLIIPYNRNELFDRVKQCAARNLPNSPPLWPSRIKR